MNIKPKLFIALILFYQSVSYSQGSWQSIDRPTNQFLKSIDFVDSLYGWAVGDSGTIIHTSDGGNSWVFQESNTTNELVDVFFLDKNLGWASEWNSSSFPFGTILLNTTDGGENWSSAPYREDNIFMNCILFLDSLNGWMGGDPHALVKTTDGGITWEQAEIDTTVPLAFFPVLSIAFYNNQYGFACGGRQDMAGVIWRTSNGGEMWYLIRPEDAPADPVQEIHTIDSLNVIGIGGDIEGFYGIDVIRTSDGGVFWEYNTLTYRGVPHDLDFRSGTEVWAPLGFDRAFIVSTDAGTNWVQIPTPDSSAIYDVMFPDSLHGFAVGGEGAILKYNPPIVNDVKVITQSTPNGFQLYQNYPNPFNPSTKIKFRIPNSATKHATNVKLGVYDILGNEVTTLLDKELTGGVYEVEFVTKSANKNITSGIYFYQLKLENFISTKKMILLR